MSEIIIMLSSILREVKIWGILLVVAFFANVYAIITYDGQWSELLSQLHVVFLLSLFFYVVLVVIRGIILGIKLLLRRWVNPA